MYRPAPRHWSAFLLGLGLLIGGALPLGHLLRPFFDNPMESLVSHSDLVVLAEVVAIEEAVARGAPLRIARLRVRETWKGAPAAAVSVPFDATLLWPQPPRYVAGETIIAFLRMDEGRWTTTTGTIEGTLHPAAREIGCLRKQVRQLARVV